LENKKKENFGCTQEAEPLRGKETRIRKWYSDSGFILKTKSKNPIQINETKEETPVEEKALENKDEREFRVYAGS